MHASGNGRVKYQLGQLGGTSRERNPEGSQCGGKQGVRGPSICHEDDATPDVGAWCPVRVKMQGELWECREIRVEEKTERSTDIYSEREKEGNRKGGRFGDISRKCSLESYAGGHTVFFHRRSFFSFFLLRLSVDHPDKRKRGERSGTANCVAFE